MLEIKKKEIATIQILTEELISKTTIRNFLGQSPELSEKIFRQVKEEELRRYKFESRKNSIPTDLFLEMRGLSYERIESRYNQKKKENK